MRTVCNFCGNKHFQKRKVQYIYRHDEKFLVVNNVPCEECTYCGERYYEANALKHIEREFIDIQDGRKKVKTKVSVPIEDFAEVIE